MNNQSINVSLFEELSEVIFMIGLKIRSIDSYGLYECYDIYSHAIMIDISRQID